jgi:hypothetical protein
MKKLTLTTAVFVAMSATSVFAHHPSADMNPNFEAVDDMLTEVVESPHADMDMYEIGNVDGMLAGTASRETGGWVSDQEQIGEPITDPPQAGSGPSMGTMGLLEDVESALAE